MSRFSSMCGKCGHPSCGFKHGETSQTNHSSGKYSSHSKPSSQCYKPSSHCNKPPKTCQKPKPSFNSCCKPSKNPCNDGKPHFPGLVLSSTSPSDPASTNAPTQGPVFISAREKNGVVSNVPNVSKARDFSLTLSTFDKAKNQVNFTTNSLSKKSSTIPFTSTTDSDGRKIWSWALSNPTTANDLNGYDGINANTNFESDGKYKWYLSFYTLPHEVSAENSGFVNVKISVSTHKDRTNKKVETSKEYQINHVGSEANYHTLELGELSNSKGVGLIMLEQSPVSNGKIAYIKDIYVIGLSAVQH